MIDKLFKHIKSTPGSFTFNEEVASVFDDMADRSIPCYREHQFLLAACALHYYKKNTLLYDLGCSTGNTIRAIEALLNQELYTYSFPSITAIDKSPAMIEIAKRKCSHLVVDWQIEDIKEVVFKPASVIIASYVLQFVSPEAREKMIADMYAALISQGTLILSEKIYWENTAFDTDMKTHYYNYKRIKGYSENEIKQKETALQKVLVPFKKEDYLNILSQCGFSTIEIIFSYFNFITILAIK